MSAEWRTTGSEYLYRRIRRSVVEDGLVLGFSDGSVVGYLPKEESDYETAATGEPAPLWHVRYDVGELKDDEEDLEEFELLESLIPLGGLPGDPDCGLARHGPPTQSTAEASSDRDDGDSKAAAEESMDTTGAGESGVDSDEDEDENSDGGESEEEDEEEDEDGPEENDGGGGESEYEKLRRERMAQNQAFLANLGFNESQRTLPAEAAQRRRAYAATRRPQKPREREPAAPMRRSSRNEGKEHVTYDADALFRQLSREEREREVQERRQAIEQARALKSMNKAQLEQWQRARQAAKQKAKLHQHSNAPPSGSGLSLHEQRLLRARGVGGRGAKELAAWARRAAAAATVLEQHLEAHPHDSGNGSSGDSTTAAAPSSAKMCGALASKPTWLRSLGPVDPSSAALVREHDLHTWFYDDAGAEEADAAGGGGAEGDAGVADDYERSSSRNGRNVFQVARHGLGDAMTSAHVAGLNPDALTRGHNKCQFKMVQQLDDDGVTVIAEFHSQAAAARALGIHPTKISNHVNGWTRSADGFKLRSKPLTSSPPPASGAENADDESGATAAATADAAKIPVEAAPTLLLPETSSSSSSSSSSSEGQPEGDKLPSATNGASALTISAPSTKNGASMTFHQPDSTAPPTTTSGTSSVVNNAHHEVATASTAVKATTSASTRADDSDEEMVPISLPSEESETAWQKEAAQRAEQFAHEVREASEAAAAQPFKTGDKVEAKFRSKPKYYDAMVANYCPATHTYALRYDDGDVEISVAASLVRRRPDPMLSREVAAQSLWSTAPLAPTGNEYLAAASHLPGSNHKTPSSLSSTSPSGSTTGSISSSSSSSSAGPRYEGRLFVAQIGDQAVYYPGAHTELLLGAKAAHALQASHAQAAARRAETGRAAKEDSTEAAATAAAAASSPQMRALRAAAEKGGAPGWLGAPGAPHAVDCTVTAVQPRFSADWAQKLYARCDRMLSVMECHESFVWFSEPVQPEAQGVPDYFDVIHRPMDFGTIRAQLDGGIYVVNGGFDEFLADCRLVFSNALLYNYDTSSEVAQAALGMRADLEASVKEMNALPPDDPLVPRLETVLRLVPNYILAAARAAEMKVHAEAVASLTAAPTSASSITAASTTAASTEAAANTSAGTSASAAKSPPLAVPWVTFGSGTSGNSGSEESGYVVDAFSIVHHPEKPSPLVPLHVALAGSATGAAAPATMKVGDRVVWASDGRLHYGNNCGALDDRGFLALPLSANQHREEGSASSSSSSSSSVSIVEGETPTASKHAMEVESAEDGGGGGGMGGADESTELDGEDGESGGRGGGKQVVLRDATGKVLREYETQRDAAVDLNVSQSCISNAVNGRIPNANGYLVSYKGAPFISPDDAAAAMAQLESKKRALPHEQQGAGEATGRKLRRKIEGKKLPQFNTLRSGVVVAILNADGTAFETPAAASTTTEVETDIPAEVLPDEKPSAMDFDDNQATDTAATCVTATTSTEAIAPSRSRRASAKKPCIDGNGDGEDPNHTSMDAASSSTSASETSENNVSTPPRPYLTSPPPGAVSAATFFAHLPPWRSLVVREHLGPDSAQDRLPPLQTRRLSVWECRAPSLGEPGGPTRDAAWLAKQLEEQTARKATARKATCALAVENAWRQWARTEGPRAQGAAASGGGGASSSGGGGALNHSGAAAAEEESAVAVAQETMADAQDSSEVSPLLNPMEAAWRQWAQAEGPRAANTATSGISPATIGTISLSGPQHNSSTVQQSSSSSSSSSASTSNIRPWPRMCPLERKRLILALEAVMTTPTAEPFLEIPVEKRRRRNLGRPRSDASISFAAKAALLPSVEIVGGAGSKRKKQTLGSQPKKAQKGVDNSPALLEEAEGQEEVEDVSDGRGDSFLPYDAVVAGPISLELILSRLRKGRYRHYTSLVADLQRIYFNAAEYNASGSEIVRRARMLVRLALGLLEASRGAAPSKAIVQAATARAAAAATAANNNSNKDALPSPKPKAARHRPWQAHLRALAAKSLSEFDPSSDAATSSSSSSTCSSSSTGSSSTGSSSTASSSSTTGQSLDVGQLIDRALAAALRDSVAYRTTAHDARDDAYSTSLQLPPPVDSSSSTDASAHLTSDAWLHSSTAVLAELAMAKALWDPSAPSAASAAALHVLDVYGGWDLWSSSSSNGSSANSSKERAIRKQAADLSFEEMETSALGSSAQGAAGGGGGGSAAVEASADGSRKRTARELKRERRLERERLGLPARIPGRPFSSLIHLPPKTEGGASLTADNGGGKSSSSSSSSQQQQEAQEDDAPPASTVRRDFGPPHGVFFGTVMTYVTPYYLVQYPDGDTEDMAPSDILRLRVPEASGLDPTTFGGHRRRRVTLRLGAGKGDGDATEQGTSKGGIVAHTIAQLPPLPSEEAEVDALI